MLSPCVRQVGFSGTTCSIIPQRKEMNPRSFCQLVPCSSFPFVLVRLLQLEEKLSAFVSVRCLQAEVCPRTCLALVPYSRIVFRKQRTFRIEQTKGRAWGGSSSFPYCLIFSTASASLFSSQ